MKTCAYSLWTPGCIEFGIQSATAIHPIPPQASGLMSSSTCGSKDSGGLGDDPMGGDQVCQRKYAEQLSSQVDVGIPHHHLSGWMLPRITRNMGYWEAGIQRLANLRWEDPRHLGLSFWHHCQWFWCWKSVKCMELGASDSWKWYIMVPLSQKWTGFCGSIWTVRTNSNSTVSPWVC